MDVERVPFFGRFFGGAEQHLRNAAVKPKLRALQTMERLHRTVRPGDLAIQDERVGRDVPHKPIFRREQRQAISAGFGECPFVIVDDRPATITLCPDVRIFSRKIDAGGSEQRLHLFLEWTRR